MFPETSRIINTILTNLKVSKHISQRQYEYLKPPDDPRPRHFYTLPKIHKDPKSWCIPFLVPKGRPIVSGCSSESFGAEELVDFYLKPLAQIQPTYIRDSIHFKALLLDQRVTPDTTLATMDVQSLYTMIDISDGIRAIRHFFQKHEDPTRPDHAILSLLRICLSRNDFTFAGLWFLQVKGTAMGKIFAPNYACLFMSRWEEAALNTALASDLSPSLFLRYIDDIFITFNKPATELPALMNILNSQDPNIQLTQSSSLISVDFLDVTVFKQDNHLLTRLYSKPTDSHQLLHKGSFHPSHTFKGIVKSQILRFARLNDLQIDLSKSCTILRSALVDVGYSFSFFEKIKKQVLSSMYWPRDSPRILKGYSPCGSARCKCCTQSSPTLSFHGPKPASFSLITQSLSCASDHIIYGISCTLCDPTSIIYVGQTINSLRSRLNNHRSEINCDVDKPVARHFNEPGHTSNHLHICALEKTPPEALDNRENFWIKSLGTSTPAGLNVQDTVTPMISIPLVLDFHPSLGPWFRQLTDRAAELELPFRPLRASRRHRNVQSIIAPTKVKVSLAPIAAAD